MSIDTYCMVLEILFFKNLPYVIPSVYAIQPPSLGKVPLIWRKYLQNLAARIISEDVNGYEWYIKV